MATHKTVIPAGYSPRLSLRDTEIAIKIAIRALEKLIEQDKA